MAMIMIDDYGLILYVFLHKLISCITYLNHFTYKYLYLRSLQEQMIEEEQILQLSNDGSTSQNQSGQFGLNSKAEPMSLMNHGIDVQKEIIQMKKVKVSYKNIQKQLKFCVVESYRKCLERRCIDKVLKKLSSNKEFSQSKIVHLNDDGALHLISKMTEKIQEKKIQNKISKSLRSLQNLRGDLQTLNSIEMTHQQKLATLKILKLEKNMHSKQTQLINQLQALVDSILKQKIQKQAKYSTLQRQIIQLQRQKSVYKLDQVGYEYKTLLVKTIRKMARNLFVQTILFLVEVSKLSYLLSENQVDQSEVYVVFQQSYHSIKIKKRYLIQIMGVKIYLQKVAIYQSIYVNSTNTDRAKDLMCDLMCCHKCMRIFPIKSLKFCQQQIGIAQNKSYPSTDYHFYRQLNLNKNYHYQSTKQYVIPYFIYNQSNHKQRCNRAICRQCQPLYPNLNKQKTYKCSFCDGSCNCSKCVLAYALVKVIGYDKEDPNVVRSYDKILNLLKKQRCSYKMQVLNLRRIYDDTELKLYSSFQQKTNSYRKIIKSISPPIKKQKIIMTQIVEQNEQVEDDLQHIFKDPFNKQDEQPKQFQYFKKEHNYFKNLQFQIQINQQQNAQLYNLLQGNAKVRSNSDIVNDEKYQQNFKFPEKVIDDSEINDLFLQ